MQYVYIPVSATPLPGCFFSTDGVNFTTLDHTNNQFYGFTSDKVSISARYVKIELITAVIQNSPNNWYTPALWEVQLLGPQ